MYKIKVELFEGPLDLLLQLIEQDKLDITEVSLSQVTDQYLENIHAAHKRIEPGDLADFLSVAARLLLIKSRLLLPYLSMLDDDEDEPDLEQQLKMYQLFHDASKKLQKIISRKHFGFVREKLFIQQEVGFQPPQGVTTKKLSNIYSEIINRLSPVDAIPESMVRRTVSIGERIAHIRQLLDKYEEYSFHKILSTAKDKTEVIISFLALLELTKQEQVKLTQEKTFTDIIIRRIA